MHKAAVIVSGQVSGRRVCYLESDGDGRLAIVFVDGSALVIRRSGKVLTADFTARRDTHPCPDALQPTQRQQAYLDFIKKYLDRFGFSPAESDIQRHFLVSAPAVNSMVQTLQRLGFIMRQQGVARSIRLVEMSDCRICGRKHFFKLAHPGPS